MFTHKKFILSFLVFMFISLLCLAGSPYAASLKPRGLAYDPFRDGQAPWGPYPTKNQIKEDISLLKGVTYSILTYSVDGILGDIPKLARGLQVVMGIWLDSDLALNEQEIEKGIKIANSSSTVCAVMVGSEVLLSGDLTESQLIEYIRRVKEEVNVPVGTAESWYNWTIHPNLANASDFLLVNIHPYWESVQIDSAASFVSSKYWTVANMYPEKGVVISETGWPSAGETYGNAVPSEANQAKFISDFARIALEEDIPYFLFEAFNQKWKSGLGVESNWGIFNSDRTLKPLISSLLSSPPPLVEIRSVINGGAVFMSASLLTGYAYGADPVNFRVVLYAGTNAWYVQPYTIRPYTRISPNGRWSNRTHLGYEYAALLVSPSFDPPDVTGGLPQIDGISVFAISTRPALEYLPPPLPRLLRGM